MLTKEDLTRWIQSEIIGWQAEAKDNPRSFKAPGVLAFRLAERTEELLLSTRIAGFLEGALAARERPSESLEELQEQIEVPKVTRAVGRTASRFEELER